MKRRPLKHNSPFRRLMQPIQRILQWQMWATIILGALLLATWIAFFSMCFKYIF
ncbi:MAG: hypothetical protein IKO46_06070 [Salinivirgaceae bacterium]|nr:hypothetical protein [Salinivirgaceae bacterium]